MQFSKKKERIDIYLQLAELYILNNELTKAESNCRSALNLTDEINYDYKKAISLKKLGEIKCLKKEYKNAINILLEIDNINNNIFNDIEKSELYYILGNSYFQIYYFEQSLEYGLKAIEYNQDINPLLYKTFCLLSSSYFQLKELLNAIKFQKESLKIARSIQDSTLICAQLNEIGLSYLELNNLDSAKKYFETSLNISNKIQNHHYSSAIMDNLGEIYCKKNDYVNALLFFENALDIRKKIKYFWGIGNTSTNIGRIYLKKQDYKKTQKYLKEGEDFLNKHNEEVYKNIGLVKNYKLQAKLFEKLSKPEYALKYNKLYNELNEHLNNNEIKIHYAKTKAKYETIALQNEISNLNQLISKENRKSFIVILIGCLLFITAGIIYYHFIKNSKNKDNLLAEKTNELQQEIINKTNELQQEIDIKNRELLFTIHNILTKNYMIKNIANKLKENLGKFKDENYPLIKYIINELKLTMDETGWKEFEIYFSKAYQSFYKTLNNKFPDLSKSEKRLCALIKLELSNKEISGLTMIKQESVHTARSRLRKKLGLNENSNITEFLNSL